MRTNARLEMAGKTSKKSQTGKKTTASKSAQSQRSTNGNTHRRSKLVIVESPAKARTIEGYLGKDYRVRASLGHVRDLLKSRLSVDIENDFTPEYRVPNDKRDIVRDLKKEAAQASEVYLATDPDREGEAIAWHLIAAAEIDEKKARRVTFYEITKDAIRRAFDQPSQIDIHKVNAQQARRVLDRLVGYELSPLLWDKVRPRLSAGRVQSVAVRLIVEREREIAAFVPQEYWTIDAELAREVERGKRKRQSFVAGLYRIRGEKIELPTQSVVEDIVRDLEHAEYLVDDIKRGERRRNPQPPFITSTLQQEASRRLGFTAQRSMRVAQQLYEGVSVGSEGQIGLITYMRTDSTNISAEAQAEASAFITESFGINYLPDSPNVYSKRAKGAQEAHEAIRPTSVYRTPESLRGDLSKEQYQLYLLIWQRFVASQMAQAIYDTMRVDVLAGRPGASREERPYQLRANGSTLRFPGFLAVYADSYDEDNPADADLNRLFPALEIGDLLDLIKLLPEQHFTQPPPRYTEASLVKALEENGIGRPSTYAPILDTIQKRGYVAKESKRLVPTEVGEVVNDLLVAHFPEIVDLSFTVTMEDDLDEIASGEQDWVPVVRDFYGPFKNEVDKAHAVVPNVNLGTETLDRACPVCGRPLVIRWGRYGKFIGCSDFPTCRHTEPWLERTGVACPIDGGEIVERKSRKGRVFYGCENYPQCNWTSWKRPVQEPCPSCGGLMVIKSKEWAQCTNCEEQVRLDTLPSYHHHPEEGQAESV